MKFIQKLYVLIVAMFIVGTGFGAIDDPITWKSYSNELGDDQFEIVIEAKIEKGWHLYSQFMDMSDEGPLPTWITFETNSNFELIGKAVEKDVHTKFEEVFNMDVSYFENTAIFRQVVKRLNTKMDSLKGNVNFMTCMDGKCLPPADYTFTLNLTSGTELIKEVIKHTDSTTLSIIPDPVNMNLSAPINDCGGGGATDEDKKSYWWILFLGLAGGLVSLVTPCVFPMIPLTVSFFTKGGKDKGGIAKALLYGVSIMGVYVALSIPFHFGAESEILNNISTNFTLNIIFFVIFVFFAFSFFGYYELTLPSSWANKADKAADVGGFLGIIFMALVLAIVSFSCTGPLLGSVLAGSLTADFDPWLVTIAMLGFGIGLGLPFTIFAAFPSLLKSLPQSGGWMNTVKVVLGFVEMGMALKFLSNADFVYRFGIVQRETFFLIWIVIAILTAVYLFGLISFPHDTKGAKIGKGRKIVGAIFLLFGIYLAPGVLKQDAQPWGSSLISGFPPSTWYSWYGGERHFTDYYEALVYAKETGKPLLVDFTGYACVNCRKMEENVWSQQVAENELSKYVIVSLYVDDKVALPENEQGEISIPLGNGKFKQKTLKTVGDKWSTFEALRFGQVSQPFYVLLSPEEVLLTNPVGYTPDANEYAEWLKCGLDAMNKVVSGDVDVTEISESAADNEPVIVEEIVAAKWSFAHAIESDGNVAFTMKADISVGWHLYSQYLEGDEGPLPTWIKFNESAGYELVGQSTEPDVHKIYDDVWELDILQFEGTATFNQVVEITGDYPVTISGEISYMACDEGKCVNLTEPFEYVINE